MRNLLEGISLDAIGRGNRRMLAPLKARHAERRAEYAENLGDWKAKRAKAREIKDPAKRTEALEALKEERPTHPGLVAIGCAVVGGIVLWPVLHGWHTVAVTGGATLWTLAALVAGQKPTEQAGSEDQAEQPAPVDDQTAADPPAPTAADVHRLVAAVTASGTSVLLSRITALIAARHPHQKWSTGDVRPLLAEAGIAVRAGVRTPDGNGPGVHHEDVPAPPPAPGTAPIGVVAQGQSANANANNAGPWTTEAGFVQQADPDNPARTIVIRHVSDAA